MVTFTINIPQMLVYIPYMDPMGYIIYGWLVLLLTYHFLKRHVGLEGQPCKTEGKLWIESGSSLRGGRVLLSVLLFPSILALLVSPSTRLWVSCYIVCTVTWLLQPLKTFTIHHPLKLGLENAGPIKHGPLLPCWTSGLQISVMLVTCTVACPYPLI